MQKPSNSLAQAVRLLLALSVAGVSSISAAQTTRETNASSTLPKVRVEAETEDDGRYRVNRTTSATRTDTPLQDVPQSITVIDNQVIADQAMQSMADVVRYIPGITMGQGEGNRDQPTIRGNNTTADFYVDGIRDDVQYFRDLYNVERVEALKGPNAMVFGRGGGGGVINRVTKQADWSTHRSATVQAGSYDQWRTSIDYGQALNDTVAVRVSGVYEESDSFRDFVELERYGINPTVSLALGDRTLVTFGYERFSDERIADRGVPSFNGKPIDVDESTFFGDPRQSYSDAQLDAFSALVEHEFGNGIMLRNRTRFTDYDKFYQNVFPGAVNTAGTQVAIAAYNSGTQRENLFNQTDVTFSFGTGAFTHTLLVGAEYGRQQTDNTRLTGFINNASTPFTTPLTNPTVSVPVTFRASPTDANNTVDVDVLGLYIQDQIQLTEQWQAIFGLRYETFDIDFEDKRATATVRERNREDDFVSPRVGLVYKPVQDVSLYASYSVSFLPSSGDQFGSLTDVSEGLDPEEFHNYEVGAKWDLNDRVAINTAIYQLDRENTSAPHPTLSGVIVQTGKQRSRGGEIEVSGEILPSWTVLGGYAYQDVEIARTTSNAVEGATVALTPKNKLSLWNRYDFSPSWGAALGLVYQDEMFAAIDNTVTLPDFTRVDAAVFFTMNQHLRAQLNIENLLDEEYFVTAHSNNNISPGSPTTVRLSLTGSF